MSKGNADPARWFSRDGSFRDDEAGTRPIPPMMLGVAKGVYVGGCVKTEPGPLGGGVIAHAHVAGDHKGWVCFQLPELLADLALCAHELAHLLTEEGHTDRWRQAMQKLGYPLSDQEFEHIQQSDV